MKIEAIRSELRDGNGTAWDRRSERDGKANSSSERCSCHWLHASSQT